MLKLMRTSIADPIPKICSASLNINSVKEFVVITLNSISNYKRHRCYEPSRDSLENKQLTKKVKPASIVILQRNKGIL